MNMLYIFVNHQPFVLKLSWLPNHLLKIMLNFENFLNVYTFWYVSQYTYYANFTVVPVIIIYQYQEKWKNVAIILFNITIGDITNNNHNFYFGEL